MFLRIYIYLLYKYQNLYIFLQLFTQELSLEQVDFGLSN